MRKRILLVEDDAEQRTPLGQWLRHAGYDVTEAASAEDALVALAASGFDLLVTDYRLGGATGSWLARVAAQTEPNATPSLLMTAHRDLSDAQGLEVLRKPLHLDTLGLRIEQALAISQLQVRALAAPAQRAVLIHYVNGSAASERAVRNLEAVLGDYDGAQIALTTVDLRARAAQGHEAELDKILVTPTLLRTFPRPRIWLAGDLRERALVDRLLEQAGVRRR